MDHAEQMVLTTQLMYVLSFYCTFTPHLQACISANSCTQGAVSAANVKLAGLTLESANVTVFVNKYSNRTTGVVAGAFTYYSGNSLLNGAFDTALGGIQYLYVTFSYNGTQST